MDLDKLLEDVIVDMAAGTSLLAIMYELKYKHDHEAWLQFEFTKEDDQDMVEIVLRSAIGSRSETRPLRYFRYGLSPRF